MGIRAPSTGLSTILGGLLAAASPAQTVSPDEAAFRALYRQMNGRRFLFEIVKLYANGAD